MENNDRHVADDHGRSRYVKTYGDMETPQHGKGSKIRGNPSKSGFLRPFEENCISDFN